MRRDVLQPLHRVGVALLRDHLGRGHAGLQRCGQPLLKQASPVELLEEGVLLHVVCPLAEQEADAYRRVVAEEHTADGARRLVDPRRELVAVAGVDDVLEEEARVAYLAAFGEGRVPG
jgi:hypothetical protein